MRRSGVRVPSAPVPVSHAEGTGHACLPRAVRPEKLDDSVAYRTQLREVATIPARQARTASYRLHKASSQAVVTLSGPDVYPGGQATSESRRKYDRIVAEWLARGRCIPDEDRAGPLVSEMLLACLDSAETYYRKNSQPMN